MPRHRPQSPLVWLMPLGTLVQFVVPRWAVAPVARCAGWLAWLVNARQRRLIETNLSHILDPQAAAATRRTVCVRTFQNLTMSYLDLLRVPVIRGRIAALGEFDPTALDQAMAQGRGLVLVTPHLGNWDLAGVFLGARGYPISAVVEPIPRGWTRTFNRYRNATAMQTIPIPERRAIARALKDRRLLALVADRDFTGRGLPCPSFDAVRCFPKGPAAYALKFGTPVVLGYFVFQNRPGRPPYYACVEPPIEFSPSGDTTADIDRLTRLIADSLNRLIARFPDQWPVFRAAWQ